jgi:hypothetical protein
MDELLAGTRKYKVDQTNVSDYKANRMDFIKGVSGLIREHADGDNGRPTDASIEAFNPTTMVSLWMELREALLLAQSSAGFNASRWTQGLHFFELQQQAVRLQRLLGKVLQRLKWCVAKTKTIHHALSNSNLDEAMRAEHEEQLRMLADTEKTYRRRLKNLLINPQKVLLAFDEQTGADEADKNASKRAKRTAVQRAMPRTANLDEALRMGFSASVDGETVRTVTPYVKKNSAYLNSGSERAVESMDPQSILRWLRYRTARVDLQAAFIATEVPVPAQTLQELQELENEQRADALANKQVEAERKKQRNFDLYLQLAMGFVGSGHYQEHFTRLQDACQEWLGIVYNPAEDTGVSYNATEVDPLMDDDLASLSTTRARIDKYIEYFTRDDRPYSADAHDALEKLASAIPKENDAVRPGNLPFGVCGLLESEWKILRFACNVDENARDLCTLANVFGLEIDLENPLETLETQHWNTFFWKLRSKAKNPESADEEDKQRLQRSFLFQFLDSKYLNRHTPKTMNPKAVANQAWAREDRFAEWADKPEWTSSFGAQAADPALRKHTFQTFGERHYQAWIILHVQMPLLLNKGIARLNDFTRAVLNKVQNGIEKLEKKKKAEAREAKKAAREAKRIAAAEAKAAERDAEDEDMADELDRVLGGGGGDAPDPGPANPGPSNPGPSNSQNGDPGDGGVRELPSSGPVQMDWPTDLGDVNTAYDSDSDLVKRAKEIGSMTFKTMRTYSQQNCFEVLVMLQDQRLADYENGIEFAQSYEAHLDKLEKESDNAAGKRRKLHASHMQWYLAALQANPQTEMRKKKRMQQWAASRDANEPFISRDALKILRLLHRYYCDDPEKYNSDPEAVAYFKANMEKRAYEAETEGFVTFEGNESPHHSGVPVIMTAPGVATQPASATSGNAFESPDPRPNAAAHLTKRRHEETVEEPAQGPAQPVGIAFVQNREDWDQDDDWPSDIDESSDEEGGDDDDGDAESMVMDANAGLSDASVPGLSLTERLVRSGMAARSLGNGGATAAVAFGYQDLGDVAKLLKNAKTLPALLKPKPKTREELMRVARRLRRRFAYLMHGAVAKANEMFYVEQWTNHRAYCDHRVSQILGQLYHSLQYSRGDEAFVARVNDECKQRSAPYADVTYNPALDLSPRAPDRALLPLAVCLKSGNGLDGPDAERSEELRQLRGDEVYGIKGDYVQHVFAPAVVYEVDANGEITGAALKHDPGTILEHAYDARKNGSRRPLCTAPEPYKHLTITRESMERRCRSIMDAKSPTKTLIDIIDPE